MLLALDPSKSIRCDKEYQNYYIINVQRFSKSYWFSILTPFCNKKLYFYVFQPFSIKR
eukprot:UN08800